MHILLFEFSYNGLELVPSNTQNNMHNILEFRKYQQFQAKVSSGYMQGSIREFRFQGIHTKIYDYL